MALARSASGPGGLSINTSSANSLFGLSSTTPAAGGMFANTQASKPLFGAATTTTAPSGGLFGSVGTQPTTPQPSGGLFGSTTTTSQPQTGGLFGSTAATTQPQTGGLFGSTQQVGGGLFGNANTSQPAPSGGLFGSTTTPQPQQSGGLFGGLGAQNQNQNQNTGGGLFGGSTTQQNQGGGLFGGQNQNKPATSLFGGLGNNQNQQAQPQQSSMFSSTQNQTQQPLAGGFLNNQQQQTVPGTTIDMANIKSSTRYNDLHEDLKKQLDLIDNVISLQIRHKNECEAMMPKHEEQLSNVPSDVEYCSRKLKGIQDIMDDDAEAVNVLRDLIKKDAEHAKLSFRAIDNLKLPPQYHNSGHWPTKGSGSDSRSQGTGAGDAREIVRYFSETADELTGKLARYQKNITEIESHLRGVEASTAQQIHTYISRRSGAAGAQNDEIQELAESLQDFERGILNVAGKVGSIREGVQSLQLGAFMGPTNGGTTTTKRSNVY